MTELEQRSIDMHARGMWQRGRILCDLVLMAPTVPPKGRKVGEFKAGSLFWVRGRPQVNRYWLTRYREPCLNYEVWLPGYQNDRVPNGIEAAYVELLPEFTERPE